MQCNTLTRRWPLTPVRGPLTSDLDLGPLAFDLCSQTSCFLFPGGYDEYEEGAGVLTALHPQIRCSNSTFCGTSITYVIDVVLHCNGKCNQNIHTHNNMVHTILSHTSTNADAYNNNNNNKYLIFSNKSPYFN